MAYLWDRTGFILSDVWFVIFDVSIFIVGKLSMYETLREKEQIVDVMDTDVRINGISNLILCTQ